MLISAKEAQTIFTFPRGGPLLKRGTIQKATPYFYLFPRYSPRRVNVLSFSFGTQEYETGPGVHAWWTLEAAEQVCTQEGIIAEEVGLMFLKS